MNISIDVIFIIILATIILFCYCSCNNNENFDNIANADIEAIRNLNSLAAKLTAGQLTTPGNLTITGDTNTSGNINISTGKMITVRDVNHGIGYRSNDSKIDGPSVYGFSGGALASTNGGYRNALTWDNASNVTVGGDNVTNGKMSVGGPMSNGILNIRNRDGRYTHFNWDNGENYIRGNTNHDNTLRVGQLCIGSTCIGEKELKFLTTGFYLNAANLPRSDNSGDRWHAGENIHLWSDGVLRTAGPASALRFLPVNGV